MCHTFRQVIQWKAMYSAIHFVIYLLFIVMHFNLCYLKKAQVHHWSLREKVGKTDCDKKDRLTSEDT